MFILILMVDRNLWMGYQKQHAFLSQGETTVIQFGKKQGFPASNVIFVYQNVSDIQQNKPFARHDWEDVGQWQFPRGYWRVGDRLLEWVG